MPVVAAAAGPPLRPPAMTAPKAAPVASKSRRRISVMSRLPFVGRPPPSGARHRSPPGGKSGGVGGRRVGPPRCRLLAGCLLLQGKLSGDGAVLGEVEVVVDAVGTVDERVGTEAAGGQQAGLDGRV